MKIPTSLLGGSAFALAGRRTPAELAPVKIDLSKYMGTWRVIGCAENPVENQFTDATETYTLMGVTHVDVTFKWRQGSLDAPVQTHQFRGRIVDHPSHGIWKMKLFPLFSATYIVVEVAPDYSWAAVAHPSRKFGWLLSRQRQVADDLWARFLKRFAAMGYDPSIFRKVQHP